MLKQEVSMPYRSKQELPDSVQHV
ncbi:cation transport regulator, partial [Acinetobacter baumannii]